MIVNFNKKIDEKKVFSSKADVGHPFLFLYNERTVNWTLANIVKWTLYETRCGIKRFYNDNRIKAHPFYMAFPTSYGVILCYLSFTILSGFVDYLHTGIADPHSLKTCLYWLVYIFLRWGLKLRRASYSYFYFTKIVRKNLMFGMFLFIISEIMVFFGLFWTYLHSSVNPTYAIGGVWPPVGIDVLEWWHWPALGTAILLYSGMTVNVFYYSMKTTTLISYMKADNQVKRAQESFLAKTLDITAIFVENKFFKILFPENLKDFLNNMEKHVFLKSTKNEIKQFEKWFYHKEAKTLAYDHRLHQYVIEQKHGYVYYRIRIYYGYIRPMIFNILSHKAWVYGTFIFEYFAWRLRFVFGGVTYTVIAGGAFVYCQNYEYAHASYDITDGIYGTIFYSLTGLHGLHVIGGVVFLLYMYWRFMSLRRDFVHNFYPHFGITASVWYWHFVDVVWFCVYFIVYIWGSITIILEGYYLFLYIIFINYLKWLNQNFTIIL